jgi:tetratricopeptide (TPR) repeat protein
MILPVLGVIPFTYQTISTVADHYVYLSMLGFALAVSTFTLQSVFFKMAALIFLIACSTSSAIRTEIWQNDPAFFQDMFNKNPSSRSAMLYLGNKAVKERNYELALDYFKKVKEAEPENSVALANYALTLNRLHRYADILLEIRPLLPSRAVISDHPHLRPYWAALFEVVGSAQMHFGQFEESKLSLCQALWSDPQGSQANPILEELSKKMAKADKPVSDCP